MLESGSSTSESENYSSTIDSSRPTRQFPRILTVLTIIALIVVLGLRFGYEPLNESFNLNPGVPNVVPMALVVLVLIAWNVWIIAFSRWRWMMRLLGCCLIGLLPFAGVLFFQPVFDGDLGFVRFEPRFSSVKKEYAKVKETATPEGQSLIALKPTEFDFPQFMGPGRNATVNNVDLAESWDSLPPETVWTIDVGEGWSGFSVVGEYAFTQEQRDDQELVVCYEIESGQQVWAHASDRRHEDLSAVGRVGPRATPSVIEGTVFISSGTGVVDCLNATSGELIWSADVPDLVGIEQTTRVNGRGLEYTQENSSLTWGRSASPLVYQDIVIVPAGGPVGGQAVTMIAFDRKTGEERWRGGERTISYGSPTLIDVAGKTQVCLVTEDHAVGHDPETGEELWAHPWPGHSDGDASCSQITPLDDSLLLLSKGYGVGGQVILVSQDDDQWTAKTTYSNPRVLKTKMTNPVIYKGHAYSLSDGFLECARVPELKRRWKKRGRFGNGQLLLVGDKLLVHAESGTLHLVAATPEKFQELGKYNTIEGVCWNTIALSEDRLLVRSELEAALIRLPLANSESNPDTASRDPADDDVALQARPAQSANH